MAAGRASCSSAEALTYLATLIRTHKRHEAVRKRPSHCQCNENDRMAGYFPHGSHVSSRNCSVYGVILVFSGPSLFLSSSFIFYGITAFSPVLNIMMLSLILITLHVAALSFPREAYFPPSLSFAFTSFSGCRQWEPRPNSPPA